MAKTFDERLADLSVKLGKLSEKAAAASEDAKLYSGAGFQDPGAVDPAAGGPRRARATTAG